MVCSFFIFKQEFVVLMYFQQNVNDVSNFDREFTSEEPMLTPPHDPHPIHDEDQRLFEGFDYVHQQQISWC